MKEYPVINYNELYKMYAEDMYAYGMAFKIDKDTVLDAIHDVFLHIIERESSVNVQSNAKFYLLVSLRNRLFSIKRKELPILSMDDTDNNNFTITLNGMEDVIEDGEERNEIISRIENILNELTGKQREVIYLRYMQELSYEQIAELLNISPKAVRKLTYRALSRIKELYGGPLSLFIQLLSMYILRGGID